RLRVFVFQAAGGIRGFHVTGVQTCALPILLPTMRRRGPVAIIGCSTSVATPPFSASGYFSPRQARETVNLLKQAGEEGLFRIVLIHHPPIHGATSSHKRMIGIRRFAAAISTRGAQLVMRGPT